MRLIWQTVGALLLLVGVVSCGSIASRDQALGAGETGMASYYADRHEHHKTASGELYVHHLKTAAHRTLPFGTYVKVTNLDNGKSVRVKINDRGPFVQGRIIDLSKSAFSQLGELSTGLLRVRVEPVE